METNTKKKFIHEVLDILSSIPYLKRILKSMFIFSGVFIGIAFMFGQWESTSELIKKGLFFGCGNLIIVFFFRFWDKYDREKASSRQNKSK